MARRCQDRLHFFSILQRQGGKKLTPAAVRLCNDESVGTLGHFLVAELSCAAERKSLATASGFAELDAFVEVGCALGAFIQARGWMYSWCASNACVSYPRLSPRTCLCKCLCAYWRSYQ